MSAEQRRIIIQQRARIEELADLVDDLLEQNATLQRGSTIPSCRPCSHACIPCRHPASVRTASHHAPIGDDTDPEG